MLELLERSPGRLLDSRGFVIFSLSEGCEYFGVTPTDMAQRSDSCGAHHRLGGAQQAKDGRDRGFGSLADATQCGQHIYRERRLVAP